MLKPYQKKCLIAAAVAIAPLFILYAIYTYGVPVPYWDQWELVPLLQKMHDRDLRIADLWAQHNEHRIILPQMVMLALASVSGWNICYEFATNYILAVAIFLFLWSMLRNTFQNKPPAWLVIAFSLVVFSPIQFENWLWGWQIQFFMTLLGTVVAVWSLQRWPGSLKGLLVAIAAAIFAAYSLSSGLFVWVAVMPMIFFTKPRNWRLLVGWCLAGAATIGLYLYHYVKPAEHPSLLLFMKAPAEFARYVLMYLGSPLGFGNLTAAMTAGIAIPAVGGILFILVLRRNRGELAAILPWLVLAIQAIICATATGIGRLGFSARQALSSRYATLASLLLLAALVILARWMAVSRGKKNRILPQTIITAAVLLAISAFAYVRSFTYGVTMMEDRRLYMSTCLSGLKAYPNTPNEILLGLYPRINVIRERAKILSELGIIVPRQPATRQTTTDPKTPAQQK
jgi:hypothetical protein